jgi:hypothetical protein
MLGAPAYKPWEARLQELSEYVQRYPVAEWCDSSHLTREEGPVDAPSGGAARTAACKGTVGIATVCPAQPVVAPSQLTVSVVTLGRPALVTEVPAPAKAGAAVITLHRCEESRSAAVHRQQGRRPPAPEALVPPGPALAAMKKRASRHASKSPWLLSQDPPPRWEEKLGPAVPRVLPRNRPPGSDALCMKQASTTSWIVATSDTWWGSTGIAFRSEQLWG